MTDGALVEQILHTDSAWAAYAIADLQPGFAEQCGWFVHEGGAEGSGLVMLYSGLTPPILFAMGPGAAVAAALAQAANAGQLPESVYLSIRAEHEAAVGCWYDLSPAWSDRRPMLRMVLDETACVAAAEAAATKDAVRLATADAPRLAALYARGGPFAPDAFDAGQIENGVFHGVEGEDGNLLAAGGTHIVDWHARVAAIGNFYTLPAARGRGHAGALLDAIVCDLHAGGVATIVLNVDQRNEIARRLYARHGFAEHCPFVEGSVRRIKP
jgi:ribosomal protein S18 acetylase RimI-like enzyme